MNLLIAENKGFSPAALEVLQARMRVRSADLTRERLLASLADCEVLWVRLRHQIDADIIDAAPRLKAIATNTTGLNHIDVREAERRGIAVFSLRGEAEFLRDVRATAELTIALVLSLLRTIPAAARHTAAGGWNRELFIGSDLKGKTVGIVGYGRLGRIVARYLHAFDTCVLATTSGDNSGEADAFVEFVPFDDLLARGDIVSVHVSLTEQTRNMFNAPALDRMKRGALLINTARGEVVDETALLAALESERLAGAALDVLADEHNLPDPQRPLLQYAATHDNLILTPHIGGYTRQSLEKTEVFLAKKLIAWLDAGVEQLGPIAQKST